MRQIRAVVGAEFPSVAKHEAAAKDPKEYRQFRLSIGSWRDINVEVQAVLIADKNPVR